MTLCRRLPIAGSAVPSHATLPGPKALAILGDRRTARLNPPGRAAQRSPQPPRDTPPLSRGGQLTSC